MNRGIWFALGAFGLWGLLPLYWKALLAVPAPEILGHRIVWSLVFLGAILARRRAFRSLLPALARPRTVVLFTLASLLLGGNWLTYIWGVNTGHVVETSLGYFINPLVNVLLGTLFLKEQLRPGQWVAVAMAAAGVLYLTFSYGNFPWIALVLAFSFGFYGLIKKAAGLGAVTGLFLETAILFLPALGFLLWKEAAGTAAFAHTGAGAALLLAFTGVVTALPLILFGAAAGRIRLSTLGLIQYVAPTLQFLIGVLVFREPFGGARAVGFALVWLALGVYSGEGAWVRHQRGGARPPV